MQWVFGLLLSLLANAAAALSCVQPSIAADYQRAAQADETYIVVKGLLDFDTNLLPKTDWNHQQDTPQQTDIPARLTGHAMTRKGFTHPFDKDITLRVLCFGPWCGGLETGDYMAFVERAGSNHQITVGPCPGMVYENPTRKQMNTMLRCAKGQCNSVSP